MGTVGYGLCCPSKAAFAFTVERCGNLRSCFVFPILHSPHKPGHLEEAVSGVVCWQLNFLWRNDECKVSESGGRGKVTQVSFLCVGLRHRLQIQTWKRSCRDVNSEEHFYILLILMAPILWHSWQSWVCHAFFKLPFRPSGATPGEVLCLVITHLANLGFLMVNWANEWNYEKHKL